MSRKNTREVKEYRSPRVTPSKLTFKNASQEAYYDMLSNHPVVISEGPAGTGKTYLACHKAISLLSQGEIDKIHVVRPAVTADENLGFLPGDLDEKMFPYLLPLYDCLTANCTRPKALEEYVEVSPLAFMRGRTFNNCVVLCDEAQNMNKKQIFMLLTRLGENSRCFITGDLGQKDLIQDSGLKVAMKALSKSKLVGIHQSTYEDVVRSKIVQEIYTLWPEEEINEATKE